LHASNYKNTLDFSHIRSIIIISHEEYLLTSLTNFLTYSQILPRFGRQ